VSFVTGIVDGFLLLRLGTVPAVVLLFSDDVFEVVWPVLPLRVLRLRAMGTSEMAPATGVAVLEARPGLAGPGINVAISTSRFSGSGWPRSSNFIADVSNGCGKFSVSCGAVTSLATSSRTTPVACSSSAMALVLATCWAECAEEGRWICDGSGTLAEVAEVVVEFFLARAESVRSTAPVVALLMAKLAARGDDVGGGE